MNELSLNGSEIAIIGMEGRFPGAKNIDEFWKNLQNGVESISFFTDEELLASGIEADVINDPNYVKAGAVLEDIELFDAGFFGFNPREAEITDPQHRIFLECAWSALENAGYNSETYAGAIGVYAGASLSGYLLNIYLNPKIRDAVDLNQLEIGGDKDFLTTRVSYKLNLEGPSYTVQTACSTSLVAIHLACQSLLNGECDLALAGGVSISAFRKTGYFYQDGGIASPDGHCRAFDAQARGTVGGEGVGIVVLKRLDDALADGDTISAVIKGSAINNDGSNKVSYTAPRIDSQAKVIRTSQAIAEVEPETITYIEAHGTGTPLGDPIEIAALTQAFRASTQKNNFCAIASVKTNIGHLDAAAGVTSLIKTVLALKYKQIPPSLHFNQPNPQIDFANSPFYVNNSLAEWQVNDMPRRAGVSSFGIGGTNAHLILEEAPNVEKQSRAAEQQRRYQLLVLSAKTNSALETATTNLADYLQQHPDVNLADVAHTLQVGRRAFAHRRMLVCQDLNDAIQALSSERFTHFQEPGISEAVASANHPVVFMFSPQGAQYVNMARELYESEPTFSQQIDYCCEQLKPHLGIDLRTVLYPSEAQAEKAAQQLQQTAITQPALFVIEYALSKLWMAWGVRPAAMIGHSIGEYVAATLAGVFSLEDALVLVATRGRLMQQLPSGAMLSVQLSESEILPLLGKELALAASNSPSLCVVSGSYEAIDQLQQQLLAKDIGCRRLHTSHAFHSQMMEPMIEQFAESLRQLKLNPPQIPFVSNVSGTWITATEATDPNYWVRHLRQPVRFSAGIAELLKQPRILLEVGPGWTLSTFAKQHHAQLVALTSLRHPQEQQSDVAFLLNTLGQLWLLGVSINWAGYANERRYRLPLPTYPFERQRYWIEGKLEGRRQKAEGLPAISSKKPDIADWFYVPVWQESVPLGVSQGGELAQISNWLVFEDAYGVGSEVANQLQQQGQDVITAIAGEQFIQVSDRVYTINPQRREDYDALIQALRDRNFTCLAIAHFWSITPNEKAEGSDCFDEQYLGFYSLLFLAQALGKQNITAPVKLMVVTSNIHDVTGDEILCPQKATVLGACKVIPQEYSHITCCSFDLVIPTGTPSKKLITCLIREFTAPSTTENVVAYRGNRRWVQIFKPVRLERSYAGLREQGVYLITGGLGGIGLVLAEYLAQKVKAKLILLGRSRLPERSQWLQWLTTHDEQDKVSRQLRKIQALEDLGAEVLAISVDVTNEQQILQAIAQSLEQFGQIHGVIHTAGIAGGGIIQLKTPEIATSVLSPKVAGTLVLEKVFQNINIDFMVLCSSLSSILGGVGQIDYCAANAFLDAIALRASRSERLTVSINWDTWQEVGMAVETAIPDQFKQKHEESLKTGILPQEGADAFSRILQSGLPQIIVSTQELQTAIAQNYSFKSLEELVFLADTLAPTDFSQPTHPRPNLRNAYVAPRNQVEQTVANIWQQLLGIQQIGIEDDFFELGGDSLLATQTISRLRKVFDVEMSIRRLFETPTVADQALAVQQSQTEAENNSINTIARIGSENAQQKLTKLNSLSDQEVDALLNQMLAEKDLVQ